MRIPPQVGLPLVAVLFAMALGLSVCLKGREAKPGRLPERRTEEGDEVRLIYFRCRKCGETWLVYELDPKNERIRRPGDEWMPQESWSSIQRCPNCGKDDTYFVNDRKVKPKKGKPQEGE